MDVDMYVCCFSLQEQRQQRRTLRSQMEQMGVEKEALDLKGGQQKIKVEDLYDTFGTFGPLASAKILYPRDDDRKRERLCGFVAFMSRKDTDRAMLAMQGKIIKGCPLRLSLAKPVNVPPQFQIGAYEFLLQFPSWFDLTHISGIRDV
uniref:RRM domain-containing protein n=1 Tax=Parascaris equorum TaxID=6256 RepID=A0A914RQC2_PAREQ